MFDQSLDISLILSQSTDQFNNNKQLETGTSLEEILDGFSKQKSSPERSLVRNVKSRKGRTLVKQSTQQVSWIHVDINPIISSADPSKLKQIVQLPKRDNKVMTSSIMECTSTKSSLEITPNVPEAISKAPSMPSGCLSGSDSLTRKFYSRENNLLNSYIKSNPVHVRRLSSPTGLKRSLLMKFNNPDSVVNSFINPSQSEKRKSVQFKISSPNQDPISRESLTRVLQKNGDSNPGSNNQSPRTADIVEKTEHRFVKRGSFSGFRKIVEAESVKNT